MDKTDPLLEEARGLYSRAFFRLKEDEWFEWMDSMEEVYRGKRPLKPADIKGAVQYLARTWTDKAHPKWRNLYHCIFKAWEERIDEMREEIQAKAAHHDCPHCNNVGWFEVKQYHFIDDERKTVNLWAHEYDACADENKVRCIPQTRAIPCACPHGELTRRKNCRTSDEVRSSRARAEKSIEQQTRSNEYEREYPNREPHYREPNNLGASIKECDAHIGNTLITLGENW